LAVEAAQDTCCSEGKDASLINGWRAPRADAAKGILMPGLDCMPPYGIASCDFIARDPFFGPALLQRHRKPVDGCEARPARADWSPPQFAGWIGGPVAGQFRSRQPAIAIGPKELRKI